MRMHSDHSPAVSVILPAFNAEKYIGEAVKSILSQTFTDFELIVVDDGSTDRTPEIVRGYSDNRVQIVSNDKNLGLAKSLNVGIAEARGRYIARQDADDISLPERLQKQFDYLEKHPEIAVLGTARKTLLDTGAQKQQKRILSRPTFNDQLRRNCFCHGSVMIRREALDAVGGYDEMFRSSEDYELFLRMAKQFPLANLSEALYVLRRHSDRVSRKYPQALLLYRILGRELVLGKVSAEILSLIHKDGIEAWYENLVEKDKIFYHQRMGKWCMDYAHNSDALKHYRQVMRLQGASFRVIGNMLRLKARSLFQ